MGKKPTTKKKTEQQPEQNWENPKNPEKPKDSRDTEQLIRQKEEAERRRENLSGDPEK